MFSHYTTVDKSPSAESACSPGAHLIRMADEQDVDSLDEIIKLVGDSFSKALVGSREGGSLYREAIAHPRGIRVFIIEECFKHVSVRLDMDDFVTVDRFQYLLRSIAKKRLKMEIEPRHLTPDEREAMGL